MDNRKAQELALCEGCQLEKATSGVASSDILEKAKGAGAGKKDGPVGCAQESEGSRPPRGAQNEGSPG